MAEGQLSVFRAPRRDCDAEFTEKRSRFIGSVRIVLDADEAAEFLQALEQAGEEKDDWRA